jgi:hypothetical protein
MQSMRERFQQRCKAMARDHVLLRIAGLPTHCAAESIEPMRVAVRLL